MMFFQTAHLSTSSTIILCVPVYRIKVFIDRSKNIDNMGKEVLGKFLYWQFELQLYTLYIQQLVQARVNIDDCVKNSTIIL